MALDTLLGDLAGEKVIVVGGGQGVDSEVGTQAGASSNAAAPTVDISKIPAARVQKLIDTCKHDPSYAEKFDGKYGPGTAAAIFATVIGLGVLFALDEGSNMAEKKPESLGQTDEETSPEPLGQGQNTLAGSGLLLNKSGAQPPRILMNPGTGLAPLPAKIDSSFYQNKSTSNTVHTPK